MDELAYAAKMDPIALRLANYATVDPGNHKPFSTKSLRECYRIGGRAVRLGTSGHPRRARCARPTVG